MPINTDLNIAPYFDDFDIEKQFYKILFKPAYAVQARELTQLQTVLQNQVEQFGDNIYQEGSVVKGCNFTNLNGLKFVKVVDKTGFDVETFISGPTTITEGGIEKDVDIVYELESGTGLKASVITASRGFETRPPDLNTFYINYLNTEDAGKSAFIAGELLTINKYVYEESAERTDLQELNVATINVTLQSNHEGDSFGIQASPGVIFQKGHFLFTAAQTLVVSKYTNAPDGKSVGFEVKEELISSLQDGSLYDNANGSKNENAPGADRLKMVPSLVVKSTTVADTDVNFFTLIRYQEGNAVQLRDVTQFNSIAEEFARRTYEESGNYISNNFKLDLDRRDDDLVVLVGKGTAYVKGFRVENSGKISFAIDNVANTVTQENQAISIDYGSYVDITDLSGTFDINYGSVSLQNGGGTTIGTAFVRNITKNKLYLFGVKMQAPNVFESVVRVVGTGGVATIAAGSRVKEFKRSPLVFDSGTSFMRSVSDTIVPVRGYDNNISVSSDTITITAATDEDFAIDQDDMVFVDATNVQVDITSITKSNNDTEMTINLDPGVSAPAGELYFNKRLKGTKAEPHSKIAREVYVKATYSSATSRYSLGFPDTYAILGVWEGSTGAASGNPDIKDSFKLHTNQNDHFYDISYMEYISGRPQPSNGIITIKLAVFETSTSTGSYFFNINSYPIDDSDTPASNTIKSTELDTYVASTGAIYNLRNCFDFRPYVNKDSNVDYTDISPSLAGTVATGVGSYTNSFTGSFAIPALSSNINADLERYLGRIDLITMDSYGTPLIVKGEESENPVSPKVGPDELVIGEITIPGYPLLSQKEAQETGKFDCAVKVKSKGTKGYTMRDIEKIEKRIEGLEYYISLNQLEQQTENLTVLDENGLTRFKNGYIVDPMNDSNIANTNDPNYKAAIHFDKSIMTPAVKTFPIDLKYKSSTGASIFPTVNDAEAGTLGRNANIKLLGQPYATNFRNCVSNFWKYNGNAEISPSHDMAHDTVQNPTPAEIDLVSVFQDLQETMPITGVNWSGKVDETVIGTFGRTTAFGRTESGVTTALTVNDGASNAVGDFVTNVAFNPFMRSRNVKIYVSGLRPNTIHYFFFDGKSVDSHVTPGTRNSDAAREIGRFGSKGDTVKTDANGVLRAIFTIPDGTFYVGDRVLTVVDVAQWLSIDSASTSKAEIAYHAYNITQEKSTLSTRVPEFSVEETGTTTRNLTARFETRRGDPLAQTFFIKKGMGKGSNTVFISKVDLFFRRKSNTNGVTITLREVVNGYPSGAILPFSKKHLKPSEVSVSNNASSATEVEFDAPVRMDVEKEYAVVIMPDANDPNYLHYTAKVGGTDFQTGGSVVMDWGDGVLFTSTNNRAWKSYQDEDIKFNLYRHEFSSATGTITLTNDDHEFLTLSDWDGRFTPGEIIYKEVSNGYGVSMVQNTNVITQSGNDFAVDYAAGDYIMVTAGSNSEIFRIASVDSSTQMTTNHPCPFNGASATGKPLVAGKVSHYNKRTANELHLKQSSATNSKKFGAADIITGFTSGTEGTIGSVDNINISYVQPLIQKSNDSVTTTQLKGKFTDPSNVSATYDMNMNFGQNNEFTRKGAVIYSKSNNFINPKTFDIKVDMTNKSNPTSTPFVDLELSTLLAYQYQITNTAATTSKYISKRIELAEDLDAEDLNVYLTGYRPNGTNIKVYIRPQHTQDSAAFDTINWIELEMIEGKYTYSSSVNTSDFREYRYAVADANKNAGVLRYTSSAGTFDSYRAFAIKIELLAPNEFNVPFVKDYRGIALT